MSPAECRASIRRESEALLQRAAAGRINRSCVAGIVESLCREAARHNGVPERWRDYVPDEEWDR